MQLTVLAQVEGSFETVGHIEAFSEIGGEFTYAPAWLDTLGRPPISLSLPLQIEAYRTRQLQPYFEGLLPEDETRLLIARELGIPATSFLKLINAIAGECIGAVTITSDSNPLGKPVLKQLSAEDVAKLSSKGGRRGFQACCACPPFACGRPV